MFGFAMSSIGAMHVSRAERTMQENRKSSSGSPGKLLDVFLQSWHQACSEKGHMALEKRRGFKLKTECKRGTKKEEVMAAMSGTRKPSTAEIE